LSLDPKHLGDVLEGIQLVGRATDTEERAELIAAGMQARIDAVVERVSQATARPRVLSLEWIDPQICGSHWIPEMVDLASGFNCFGDKETRSFGLDWADVVDSRPEVVILMPCGFDVKRALKDVPLLAQKDGWSSMPAVLEKRVYIIDASAYTSRSGPRLVTGLEIMAEMIHLELFSGTAPDAGWLRLDEDLLRA